MKRTRIICSCCISIVMTAIFVSVITWCAKSDLEKIIITESNNYIKKWEFDHIEENDEEKYINIRFKKRQGTWNDNFESIYEIYQWLCSQIYEDNMLNEYLLNIDFIHVGEYFSIHNITTNLNNIEIRSGSSIDLCEISNKFPETTALYLFPAIYSDISEIVSFQDLKYIYFSNSLTNSEILYIKSHFPNCKIDF